MDLTYDPDQNDSGMESLTASKDDTPERRPEDTFITPVVWNKYNNEEGLIENQNIYLFVFVLHFRSELLLPLSLRSLARLRNMTM